MQHLTIEHKGYTIQKRIDTKNNTCLIYKNGDLVKCIAGSIFADGTENSIEKAKLHIDTKLT